MSANPLLAIAGFIAIAGLVFNVLWGHEVLPYLSRVSLGLCCFCVLAFSIWTA